MLDTIFIHAGLPKTGSTFIQNGMAFLAAKGMLKRVHYPVTDSTVDFDSIGSGNGLELSSFILQPAAEGILNSRMVALVESLLANRPNDARDVLISSEVFFFATIEGFEQLRQLLARHARAVKLVISVRPMRDWTYSVYMQRVKAHGLAEPYGPDWLSSYCGSFFERFKNLDRFGIETIVLSYRREGQLSAFLESIGEDPALADLVPNRRTNRSLTEAELDALRTLNRFFKDTVLGEQISGEFVKRWPDVKGASFPASNQASFDEFNESFSKKLLGLRGPVISRVRPILESPSEELISDQDFLDSSRLPGILEIVLQALRESFDSYLEDAAAFSSLRDQLIGLEPSKLFFDPIHYLLLNPDLLAARVDPWTHFLDHGRRELRESALVRKENK